MMFNKHKNISGNHLGFGTIATLNNQRMLNRDGTSNVRRIGLPFIRTADAYHALITMSWATFNLLIVASYLLINVLFALVYLAIGVEHLNGSQGHNKLEHFFDAFFFSAQTISTVGYGHISPQGIPASSVAAFESMLGLLSFALATGLLYGRFSRPTAKLVYSKNMLVAPFGDGKALMIRLANYRSNQLIDIEAQVLASMNITENGKTIRKFWPLELERNKINLLTLSWTLVHPVSEDSPVYGMSAEDLDRADAEFIILLKAFDDSFSQTVHSRTSYQNEEMVWDARFKPVFKPDENGIYTIDMSLISAYEPVNAVS